MAGTAPPRSAARVEDGNGTVHYLGRYERKLAGGSNSPEADHQVLQRLLRGCEAGRSPSAGAAPCTGSARTTWAEPSGCWTAASLHWTGMRYRPYGEDRDTGSAA